MNYHKYHPIDVVNGPGTRCTLFVSGCEHHCKGCYNQSTWSLRSGFPYTEELEEHIIRDLNDTRIYRRGLSLSGGDPLHPENVPVILRLAKRVKRECQGKDIWLWTGYRLDELNEAQREVLDWIDVLVDGKFEQSLADPALDWRGSSNQIIHTLNLDE
ncbi:anaerobic ribonucleoside-triphosphate reductase-activating protein [Vibrio mangrovi]|uniref:Anaerobic ribonucleoside-triphosphate reductase-activating protein n=1 Tax=Vibrio mangrovi TaxID=474394 RepID=A0A1Y6IT49_9VIBR|nr:anaerobic ribonucleoside-triphosphate reductase-activating protein [Vibrio mangrovi]MDW6004518.1 anaerobic ribonucleoside-triphosphate reductase-activating protein [Vibrio mangrovi]SMS00806.1 anaerobic ribonucleotide reductase-activating protein [Vibrio mangrovi]